MEQQARIHVDESQAIAVIPSSSQCLAFVALSHEEAWIQSYLIAPIPCMQASKMR